MSGRTATAPRRHPRSTRSPGGLRFANATSAGVLTPGAHVAHDRDVPAHGVRDNGGFYVDERTRRSRRFCASAAIAPAASSARSCSIAAGASTRASIITDDFDLQRRPRHGHDSASWNRVVDRALAWLAEDTDRPFLAWVHLHDPHAPYLAPAFRARFPQTLDGAYDAEVAATDFEVGRLLDALERDGRLDRTLVDRRRRPWRIARRARGTGAWLLPLCGGPGSARDCRAGDLVTRCARSSPPRRCHADDPRAASGFSAGRGAGAQPACGGARRAGRSARARRNVVSALSLRLERARRRPRRPGKFVRAPRRELYDLQTDPGERVNLADVHPQRADALERALDDLVARISRPDAVRGPAPWIPKSKSGFGRSDTSAPA